MKKIAFATLALMGVFCASATEDSFLYWMVSDSATLGTESESISGPYNAKVVAIQGDEWTYQGAGGTYLDLYYTMNQPVGAQLVQLGKGNNLNYFAGVGGAKGEGWTYFIELYHDNTIFARSDGIPYSGDAITTLIEGTDVPTAKLWAMSAFVPAAAPEPSSGLLLLLGVAGLALRRRKQITA